MEINCVEGVGIATEFPVNPTYFTQTTIVENLRVPDENPDIEEIIGVMIDPKILSLKIIDTPCAMSYEGQNLSGKKLIVELMLRQKVTYVADKVTQSVHAAHFDKVVRSKFIIVPKEINNIDIENLLNDDRMKTSVYIEDICIEKVDKRNISKCITLLLDFAFTC